MKKIRQSEKGFAAVEVLLVLLIIVIVGFVGFWVYKQRGSKPTQSATTAPATTTPAATTGTTAAVDQVLEAESKDEESINTKHEATAASNATSANSAASNLGGAYNETNL